VVCYFIVPIFLVGHWYYLLSVACDVFWSLVTGALSNSGIWIVFVCVLMLVWLVVWFVISDTVSTEFCGTGTPICGWFTSLACVLMVGWFVHPYLVLMAFFLYLLPWLILLHVLVIYA
jgi:hypothetical protein